MDQAAWIGNAIIQMSALVLLLGAPLLSGDIALLINRASGLNLQIDHELPAEKFERMQRGRDTRLQLKPPQIQKREVTCSAGLKLTGSISFEESR